MLGISHQSKGQTPSRKMPQILCPSEFGPANIISRQGFSAYGLDGFASTAGVLTRAGLAGRFYRSPPRRFSAPSPETRITPVPFAENRPSLMAVFENFRTANRRLAGFAPLEQAVVPVWWIAGPEPLERIGLPVWRLAPDPAAIMTAIRTQRPVLGRPWPEVDLSLGTAILIVRPLWNLPVDASSGAAESAFRIRFARFARRHSAHRSRQSFLGDIHGFLFLSLGFNTGRLCIIPVRKWDGQRVPTRCFPMRRNRS